MNTADQPPARYDSLVKRRLSIILLLLAAGAIINLTVAWACAAWVSIEGADGVLSPAQPDATTREILWIQTRFGHTRINRIRPVDSASWSLPHGWRDAMRHTDGGEVSRGEDRCGWPLRSMLCTNYGVVGSRSPKIAASINISNFFGVSGGIALSSHVGLIDEETWRALPLTPIWRGWVINTLLGAAVTWLLFAAVSTTRRRRRIRRGLCPRCAYDLRGIPATSDVCPECGSCFSHAHPSRVQSAAGRPISRSQR